jgi:hypothetical protein
MNATKPAWAKSSYVVTIKREHDEWIARDEKGRKRTWGKWKIFVTVNEVAAYLFHAEEIKSVVRGDDYASAIAEIWEG